MISDTSVLFILISFKCVCVCVCVCMRACVRACVCVCVCVVHMCIVFIVLGFQNMLLVLFCCKKCTGRRPIYVKYPFT